MIYFISDKWKVPENEKVKNSDLPHFIEAFASLNLDARVADGKDWDNFTPPLLGLDIEANGLDPYNTDILLLGIGIYNDVFIICHDLLDHWWVKRDIKAIMNGDVRVIGHNLKYDNKLLSVHYKDIVGNKTAFKYLYDTMIADRRIYQGLGVGKRNPAGLRFALDAITERYFPGERVTTKDVRGQFQVAKSSYVPTTEQMEYLGEDISFLLKIYEKQKQLFVRAGLSDFLINTSMPLVNTLTRMELRGVELNKDKWHQNINDNKVLKAESAYKLDKILVELRDSVIPESLRIYLKGSKYTPTPRTIGLTNTNLFGDPVDEKTALGLPKSGKPKYNPGKISWSSPAEIINIFAHLSLPLPTKDDELLIPIAIGSKVYNNVGVPYEFRDAVIEARMNGTITPEYETLFKTTETFTTGVDALKAMSKRLPELPLKEFIETYAEYSKATTRMSNFGVNYLEKIHKVTGKLHTIYRQANAITGRLQSGGKREEKDKFNSQNIPREPKYRHCFHAGKEFSVITADLSGAETVIMADMANDQNLIRMAIEEDDMHSPVAQACWRNIYLYRAGKRQHYWNDSKEFWIEHHKYLDASFYNEQNIEDFTKSQTLIISKQVNKDLRDAFKKITFGVVYGMYAEKCGKQLNVPKDEGQIVIDTIERMIPDTIRMVKAQVEQVFGRKWKNTWYTQPKGYLKLNDISNNRIIIPPAYNLVKNGVEPDFSIISQWSNVCRNGRIQGTQSDMLKTAMVLFDVFIEENKLEDDVWQMMQVHDEIVVACHKSLDGISNEYLANPRKFNYLGLEDVTVPEILGHTMTYAANMYLTNIQMKVEYQVLDTWTK